jgi:hypothetical protein
VASSVKVREVFVCSRVAEEINRIEGTDYEVQSSPCDPPDVLLVSKSKKFPVREVEVVSTPQNFLIREDNGNIRILEQKLSSALTNLGVSCCDVLVNWTELAVRVTTKMSMVRTLAEVISCNTPEIGHFYLDAGDIYDQFPALSQIVNGVRILRLSNLALEVHSVRGWWLPRDDRWIAEAVAQKSNKYRSAAFTSSFTLVVDGQSHIDSEQINAFCANVTHQEISFAEIWIVTMGKAHRLKPLPI